jgi:hypothetical protein
VRYSGGAEREPALTMMSGGRPGCVEGALVPGGVMLCTALGSPPVSR